MTWYPHTSRVRPSRYAPGTRWFCLGAAAVLGAAALAAGPAASAPSRTAGPVVMVEGREVGWDELGPLLAEAAGAAVLEEMVLGEAIRKAAAAEGVRIDAGAVEQERALFISTLVTSAGATRDQAEDLLKEVRRSRGLGERRFRELLERNAGLRAIVVKRGDVPVSDDDLAQAHRIKYGPQRKARLLLCASERDAAAAVEQIRSAGGGPAAFAQAAMDRSTDPSKMRGGMLGWVRTADPAYPVAVRAALESLKAGELSSPVSLEKGYALLMVDEVREGGGPSLDSAKEELRAEVRQVRQRSAMDRVARELLAASRVTVFDRSLGDAWEQRERPAR